MAQIITNKSAEMLTLFKDNNKKMETSFDVKIKEFEQKFEVKDRFKYVFFSYLSFDKRNFSQDPILVFDVVPLNIGKAYNGKTGKFTCKEDGIYTFSWATNEGFTSVLLVDEKSIASNNNDVIHSWFDNNYTTGSSSELSK
ncbi:heavy metal-binding protein HIP-like [Mytilus edulis]|uniref:heavy metal-binding protein HIP-like n=1 Tax=Mytilus edulis TaxID=6550 RepID=UPI0039EEFCF8